MFVRLTPSVLFCWFFFFVLSYASVIESLGYHLAMIMFLEYGRLILKGEVRGAVLLDSHKLSERDVLLQCLYQQA